MSIQKIEWSSIVEKAEAEALAFIRTVGTSPTLRGLFYALVSKSIIPNTKSAYKNLSRVLAVARKRGYFPWRLIKDETRETRDRERGFKLEDIEPYFEDISKQYLRRVLDEIDRIIEAKPDFNMVKWEGQPNRVIIALEKQALADAVDALTKGWNVPICVMRGYSSATQMKNLADRVQDIVDEDHQVHIVILTDFDPTGEDIARYVHDCLQDDFEVDCQVKKVAVNLEQIQAYNLPSTPEDAEEIKKMRRDPRFGNWKYGFFRVELDALLAIVPDEFRRILNQAMAEYFDEQIENEAQARYEEVREKASQQLQEISSEVQPARDQIAEIIREHFQETS